METKPLVPFTAFCPDCHGARTFTLSGIGVRCAVCGCTAGRALAFASDQDRETLGELCDEVLAVGAKVDRLQAMLEAFGIDHGMHSINASERL